MKRDFEEVIRGITSCEEDVDKVLKAARLERHEGPPRYLTAEQKIGMVAMVLGFLVVVFVLGLPVWLSLISA